MPNQELVEKLRKLIIRKLEKSKVYSSFKEIFIDIYSKYVWVVPFKCKKGITILNDFQKILDVSNRKPNKIWVDKGNKIYNRSLKSSLPDSNIKTYSTHNVGKSVVAERFTRPLKNKIYEYMTSLFKNI